MSASRPSQGRQSTAELAEHDYFAMNAPPQSLQSHSALAKAFIQYHISLDRRVVLVTSGGTTVPLENQTVRFIDNFSAGTRGATSAEYFLEAGYAVIFLHRQYSLLPYSRHYSHSTNCFLDFLREGSYGSVVANEEYREEMLSVLRKYNWAKKNNMLLLLPFTTITDYLWSLRRTAQLMRPLGPKGLFYLAAAVSDFFVPKNRMEEHKIQSSDAIERGSHRAEDFGEMDAEPVSLVNSVRSKKLVIDLDPVPKFLKRLVDGWAPEGMIVSFKLETDPSILVSKAHYSLDRYSHHLVIGNLLSTRKWEVVFVSPNSPDCWIRVPKHRRTRSISGSEAHVGLAALRSGTVEATAECDTTEQPGYLGTEEGLEIESLIVPEVVKMHTAMVEGAKGRRKETVDEALPAS
jgi:phosphopantothenate---cysteine ligase (ATP)